MMTRPTRSHRGINHTAMNNELDCESSYGIEDGSEINANVRYSDDDVGDGCSDDDEEEDDGYDDGYDDESDDRNDDGDDD